jgi:hypothetical protein
MRVDHARARHKRARARAVQQAPEATADAHLEQGVADVGVPERVSGVADEELEHCSILGFDRRSRGIFGNYLIYYRFQKPSKFYFFLKKRAVVPDYLYIVPLKPT